MSHHLAAWVWDTLVLIYCLRSFLPAAKQSRFR